jgi:hypothetical protein
MGSVSERAFEEDEAGQESQDGPGSPLSVGPSVATAVVLLLMLGLALRSGHNGHPAAERPRTAPPAVGTAAASLPTFVYIVGSAAEAETLQRAFDAFDEDVAAQGRPVGVVKHVVVAQTPQDVLLQRAFDFSYLAGAGHGRDVEVIDLR